MAATVTRRAEETSSQEKTRVERTMTGALYGLVEHPEVSTKVALQKYLHDARIVAMARGVRTRKVEDDIVNGQIETVTFEHRHETQSPTSLTKVVYAREEIPGKFHPEDVSETIEVSYRYAGNKWMIMTLRATRHMHDRDWNIEYLGEKEEAEDKKSV